MARLGQDGRMDFFGEQRIRTRRSLLLYGLFLLIVLAHMLVALAVMALLLTILAGGVYHWALILVIVWTLFSFIAGSFFEYRRLKAGGRAIAQRVGAVRLFIDNSQDAWEHSRGVAHQHETVSPVRYSARQIAVRAEGDFPPVYRRYYEFAQQLAIASGLSMPILYVLANEQGINGFVAGRHAQDMVLVVTQGALDKLSDEALYGLIGHEYGHILHGDAKFNMHLMVLLAGLQLLYDWSDSINNFSARGSFNSNRKFDNAVSRNRPLAQREIDAQARGTEAQTSNFTTRNEWVSYWQTQAQSSSTSVPSMPLNRPSSLNRDAPRGVWTLLLHGLSFSSMASAQLIKHSFNRQRELLADATSVQLTRSPAILETLKAIHQDALGSRLSGIADINGLSHFFFASSGADLGDVSWLATHPSLPERMSAINASAYQHFAVQVAKKQRVNQQKVKEIYEQRRLGDWGAIKANHTINANKTSSASEVNESQTLMNQSSINQAEINNDADAGLTFTQKADVVIDGRLQVDAIVIGRHKLLQPWLALPDSDLPADALIAVTDICQASLSYYVLNHSHHPLGAQALIESVLLSHQHQPLSTTFPYSLADIWCELTESFTETENSTHINTDSSNVNSFNKLDNNNVNNEPKALAHTILPHTIDHKLLEAMAGLDRRLDSALIAMAINHLRKHDLSAATIERLQQQTVRSHSNQSQQHYQQQLNNRTMLMRYQQGLIELCNTQLSADLTADVNLIKDDAATNAPLPITPKNTQKLSIAALSISELWQALHLQQLLPVLSQILGDDQEAKNPSYQQVLQAGLPEITAQLDPSGQTFAELNAGKQMMLVIFAYRLGKEARLEQPLTAPLQRNITSHNTCYVTDLRRHSRLIDIDLTAVSDANLQWLLLTAQQMNSIQLFAFIDSVPTFHPASKSALSNANNPNNQPPSGGQIAYNTYRLWLSTLHTLMLHDTIISQDEYDCLTALAEQWLGVRQLFD